MNFSQRNALSQLRADSRSFALLVLCAISLEPCRRAVLLVAWDGAGRELREDGFSVLDVIQMF